MLGWRGCAIRYSFEGGVP